MQNVAGFQLAAVSHTAWLALAITFQGGASGVQPLGGDECVRVAFASIFDHIDQKRMVATVSVGEIDHPGTEFHQSSYDLKEEVFKDSPPKV